MCVYVACVMVMLKELYVDIILVKNYLYNSYKLSTCKKFSYSY